MNQDKSFFKRGDIHAVHVLVTKVSLTTKDSDNWKLAMSHGPALEIMMTLDFFQGQRMANNSLRGSQFGGGGIVSFGG